MLKPKGKQATVCPVACLPDFLAVFYFTLFFFCVLTCRALVVGDAYFLNCCAFGRQPRRATVCYSCSFAFALSPSPYHSITLTFSVFRWRVPTFTRIEAAHAMLAKIAGKITINQQVEAATEQFSTLAGWKKKMFILVKYLRILSKINY